MACYADAAESYVLHLLVNKGDPARKPHSSRAVKIQLFKLSNDCELLQAMARDASAAKEAGVAFWSEVIEVGDIDGGGFIDTITVYRFTHWILTGKAAPKTRGYQDNYVLQGQKVAIRAITGEMEGARWYHC